jgi:hypothetical protein
VAGGVDHAVGDRGRQRWRRRPEAGEE